MKVYQALLFLILAVSLFSSCKKDEMYVERAKPELFIAAGSQRLNESLIHFVKDTVYVLVNNLVINEGQELLVDAGTLIKVSGGVSISINQGGKITARGTRTDPVVFTSSFIKGGQGNNQQASWEGIRITGGAPGAVSAFLSYVRIEFAGRSGSSLALINLNEENQLDHIQVSYSYFGSSFEFSGGNFNADRLVSYAGPLTDFDIRNGYKGNLQFLLAYRHPFFGQRTSAGSNLAGLVVAGNGSFPYISNLTVIGPDNQGGMRFGYRDSVTNGFGGSLIGNRAAGIVTLNRAKFSIRNSAILGFPRHAFYLDNAETAISIVNRESVFSHSIVHANDDSRIFYLPSGIYPGYLSDDFKAFMLEDVSMNRIFSTSSEFQLSNPFDYDQSPEPFPNTGSPLLSGSSFDADVFNNPALFEPVNFIGAVGTGSDNWLTGWSNFKPLQTSYNQ